MRLVHRGLAAVFGPPPFDPGAHAGDPGLFGPGSASWRVVGEPAAIVGGLRGLLVQLLHPAAMAGVADHSDFRADPIDRLQRTSAYVVGTTFGSVPEVLALAGRVRAVHTRVVGTTPDGRPYTAGDPHLLAWVSVALTSSFLATDRAYALRPVDAATADRFVAEQSRAAALLDPRVDLAGDLTRLPMLDDGTLPSSVVELDATLARFQPELAVGPQARAALRFLLWPDIAVRIKAGYLPVLAGALASLEPAQARLLGVPRPRLPAAAVRVQVRALLTGLRLASGPSPSVRAATQRSYA
jgi:uncharacterized protein (DUF2236 family)